MIIEGRFIVMRRNRLGVQCANGLVYIIQNIDYSNCVYKHGDIVKCDVIDENNGICFIIKKLNNYGK